MIKKTAPTIISDKPFSCKFHDTILSLRTALGIFRDIISKVTINHTATNIYEFTDIVVLCGFQQVQQAFAHGTRTRHGVNVHNFLSRKAGKMNNSIGLILPHHPINAFTICYVNAMHSGIRYLFPAFRHEIIQLRLRN